MFRNLVLSAFRSLKKKISFTIVNILGLALGMATCLSIYLYVDYDLGYDAFQKDNVYRIALNRVYPEREVDYCFIPHSIARQMKVDFPEVMAQTRFFKAFAPNTLQYGDDFFIEENILFTDSTFFDVINVRVISGDPATALHDPNAVVLTQSSAKKIFKNEDPMGKSIIFPNNQARIVTAVTEDYPANSHLTFEYLVPFHNFGFFNQSNWTGFSALSYIQLAKGVDPAAFEAKIPDFVRQYADGEIRARNGISYDEYIEAGNGYNYYLQPIKGIHLHSNLEGEIKPNGNITYVYIFSIVAVFILIIACINFMNLSTARSTERGKEVGIRKVLGSGKEQLIGQFLIESVVISIAAALIALGIIYLALPLFGELAHRPLSLLQIANPVSLVSIGGVVLVVGLLAGIYPAFFISSFTPVTVLKGKLQNTSSGVGLRNALVVVQFAISIALISATLVVFDQMNYMLNKPLGFDQESVVVIENSFAINSDPNAISWNRFETFKNELNSVPGVISSGYTTAMPGDLLPGFLVRVPGTGKESMMTRNISFDEDVLRTLDMELVEGRYFSRDFEDSMSIILNVSAVEKLGLTDPIGKTIVHVQEDLEEYTIIGIVEDFHFQSLHVNLEPVSITSSESPNQFFNKIVVKIDGENPQQTLAKMESSWNQFVTDSPFQSYFLDEDLNRFYASERATGRIFSVFTVLAIVIACIGLLGLSAYIINQRVKEIGVRKVLGATVTQIVMLLSADLTKLIGIGALFAIPIAYLWMQRWLESFAYSAGINWVVFAVAGGTALLVGLITISFQSVKAATSNPVNSLRDE